MELAKIDPDHTLSQAHPETMDLLSHAWCDFAVQALKPDEMKERSLVFREDSVKVFGKEAKAPSVMMDKSTRMDDGDKFMPTWKANDVKSWIWMQQAMHPEVNYNSFFRKKWSPWNKYKLVLLKNVSIKKWLMEIKQRRKEEQRLHRAEVHAAVSVAGVAAALAAISAENSRIGCGSDRVAEAAASAAAMVAAQCAKVAEAMGATREQLSSVIGSAIGGTSAAIRGVDTLKERGGQRSRLNGSMSVLPFEDNNEAEFDFEKCRLVLARGAELHIETADGRYLLRLVAVILSKEGKVVLRMKKLNMLNTFTKQKESIVRSLHSELYKASDAGETENGYLIVLTTDKGATKLDMMNDYQRYRTWSTTIDHMLMLSAVFTKYDQQYYKH
ncbi:Plant protein of unknown function (DUF828) with plant pleckstrin homology-like region [Striga hermonthica]|uniref:VAN3-binding protein n=1 Tax=Striga hermonthica TaxID=68872 RepID=A0A9N7R132_STRHE|nr:Plant protein of unknown function (DUF828) with plant pleckstrin homology-like region [Striga hermonthica]